MLFNSGERRYPRLNHPAFLIHRAPKPLFCIFLLSPAFPSPKFSIFPLNPASPSPKFPWVPNSVFSCQSHHFPILNSAFSQHFQCLHEMQTLFFYKKDGKGSSKSSSERAAHWGRNGIGIQKCLKTQHKLSSFQMTEVGRESNIVLHYRTPARQTLRGGKRGEVHKIKYNCVVQGSTSAVLAGPVQLMVYKEVKNENFWGDRRFLFLCFIPLSTPVFPNNRNSGAQRFNNQQQTQQHPKSTALGVYSWAGIKTLTAPLAAL